jgi:hypothetical protein
VARAARQSKIAKPPIHGRVDACAEATAATKRPKGEAMLTSANRDPLTIGDDQGPLQVWTGWLAAVLIAFLLATAISSSAAHATTPCYADVRPTRDGFVALRADPNTRGALIAKIPTGETVRLLERDGGAQGDDLMRDRTRRWIKVEWNSMTGWVFSRLLDEPLCG